MTTKQNRRNFIKTSVAGSGGLILGFNWLSACNSDENDRIKVIRTLPSEWIDFNAYIRVGDNGLVTIMSPNPEIGQNIKTSMPMIVAEELDISWQDVLVEQAPLNLDWYERQVAGGSQSIRLGWDSLRKAGATARTMLIQAAANRWGIDVNDCHVENGIISNASGDKLTYGELAKEASQLEIPTEVNLKNPSDFKIIGNSKTNVDLEDIISGKPLFGIDTYREGMLYATVVRPPAFGDKLVRFDDSEVKNVNGVVDVFQFGDKIAILSKSTWPGIKAKKLLKAEWKCDNAYEDSEGHSRLLEEFSQKLSSSPRRADGDVLKAFDQADEIFERSYEAPFMPHNCLEPMNFFADVKDGKAELVGPIQTPDRTEGRVSELLGIGRENITVTMTRMGGGFGRRLYGDFALEAAEISQISGKPVQLLFTREDDMLAGTYRPASKYRFKVGLKNKEIIAYHLTEACFNGEMFGQMPANFPCGAVDNYRVDCNKIDSIITTGAWRAPYANFLGFAEQSFIDELADHLGLDAVDLRLQLLDKAEVDAENKNLSYDPQRLKNVIQLAAEKSSWKDRTDKRHLGFSAYYSHNTYVAEVAEVVKKGDLPTISKIYVAVDCGIVINPTGALNQIEGGIIDGIGHAMFGDLKFKDGKAQSSNFHEFRLIKMAETPKIEVFFVENEENPTGLGEPALPPAGAAVANAIASALGKRLYRQPFQQSMDLLG